MLFSQDWGTGLPEHGDEEKARQQAEGKQAIDPGTGGNEAAGPQDDEGNDEQVPSPGAGCAPDGFGPNRCSSRPRAGRQTPG